MSEESHIVAVEYLCEKLTNDLKVSVDAREYNDALDEIFCFGSVKNYLLLKQIQNDKIEEIFTRSYQDHAESRDYLSQLIQADITRALDILERLSIKSVHILVGSFKNCEDSKNLLRELQNRIHYGEDLHVKYILSVILQLLTKFTFKFDDVGFLIRELGIRMKEPEVKSLALIVFVKLQTLYEQDFEQRFFNFIDSLIFEADADVGNDPLSIIIDILSELYPALTALCSTVFLGKQLDEMFRERVVAQNDPHFIKSLLQLLSAGCIDENVRSHIADNYISILEQSLALTEFKLYSALVLIKIWSFTKLHSVSIHQLATILTEGISAPVENDDLSVTDMCLEGLAYLSLKTSVKIQLRKNTKFCNHLVSMVKLKNITPHLYGSLVILANLSVFPQDSSGNGSFEPKSLRDLKSYSDLKNPNAEDDENSADSKEEVIEFNNQYLTSNELLYFVKVIFNKLSHGSKQQFVRIVYNVTRDKKSIPECIKQGCTTSMLEYLVVKPESTDLVRILACRTLTRLLIFTNPSLIFKKYSPVNAIPYLFELLPQDTVEGADIFNPDLITTTDHYEALLALTNLASTITSEGEDVCKRITGSNTYWGIIENLMLDDNISIQRSTLELISNLMSHPLPIAAKFFNFENPQSLRNFNVLVKLLQLNDVQSQRAVAAIFANVANTLPFIASELLTQKDLLTTAVDVFQSQMDDLELRRRLIMFFYSLFAVVQDGKEEQFDTLINNKEFIKGLQIAQNQPNNGEEFAEVIPLMLAKCGK